MSSRLLENQRAVLPDPASLCDETHRTARRLPCCWWYSSGRLGDENVVSVDHRSRLSIPPKFHFPLVSNLRRLSEPSARDKPGFEKPIQAVLAYEVAAFRLSVFEAEQQARQSRSAGVTTVV